MIENIHKNGPKVTKKGPNWLKIHETKIDKIDHCAYRVFSSSVLFSSTRLGIVSSMTTLATSSSPMAWSLPFWTKLVAV